MSTIQSTLYDGDFIDLTSENESQTINLKIDDDLELVNISTNVQEKTLSENNLNDINEVPVTQYNQQVSFLNCTGDGLNNNNIATFLMPVVTPDSGKFLLIDQTIMRNPNSVSLVKNLNQRQGMRLLNSSLNSPILTKLSFKNNGGQIIVEETPVVENQGKNVIIQDHVKIPPSDSGNKCVSTPAMAICKSQEIKSPISIPARIQDKITSATRQSSSVSQTYNSSQPVSFKGTALVVSNGKINGQKNISSKTSIDDVICVEDSIKEKTSPVPRLLNKPSKILKTICGLPKTKPRNNLSSPPQNEVILLDEATDTGTRSNISNEAAHQIVRKKKTDSLRTSPNSKKQNVAMGSNHNTPQQKHLLQSKVQEKTTPLPSPPQRLAKKTSNISSQVLTKSIQNNFQKKISANKQIQLLASSEAATSSPSSSKVTLKDAKANSRSCYVVYSIQQQAKSAETADEVILVDDPLEAHSAEVVVEPSCSVTPVDIKEILSKGQKSNVEQKGRCNCSVLQEEWLYTRGFTAEEKTRPVCLKYLNSTIASDMRKIKRLKRAQKRFDFIQCHSEPGYFLPETFKCEPEDNDEMSVEYNNVEKQLEAEKCCSAALPVIKEVISEVQNEVVLLKKQGKKRYAKKDLQKKLAKPEEALRLIQKGLELIKNWSEETKMDRKKMSKIQSNRKSSVIKDNTKKANQKNDARNTRDRKRTIKSRGGIGFVYEPVMKKTKAQNSTRGKPEVKDVNKKRKRKRLEEISETSDLLIVKKVDILNEKRRKR